MADGRTMCQRESHIVKQVAREGKVAGMTQPFALEKSGEVLECCLDSFHRQIPKGSFIIPDLIKATHSPVLHFILEPLYMGQS